jgi:phosphopantetheinyl transferase
LIRLFYTLLEAPPPKGQGLCVAQHQAGRALLRQVLGCDKTALRYRPGGKPYLPDGPAFSLSHSGALVLLAVSDEGEVGCDAEDAARPLRNPARLRAKLAAPGEEDWPVRKLWVRAEALFKAGGRGAVCFPELPGYVLAVAGEGVSLRTCGPPERILTGGNP